MRCAFFKSVSLKMRIQFKARDYLKITCNYNSNNIIRTNTRKCEKRQNIHFIYNSFINVGQVHVLLFLNNTYLI